MHVYVYLCYAYVRKKKNQIRCAVPHFFREHRCKFISALCSRHKGRTIMVEDNEEDDDEMYGGGRRGVKKYVMAQ